MRVIGGAARGRRLHAPPGRRIRPTLERVREALFDILGERVIGVDWLDVYAGTGSVGIEALSRGARAAIFVEADPILVRVLRKNLEATGLAERGRILPGDCREVLPELEREGARFSVVFLDPPYGAADRDPVLEWVGGSRLPGPSGRMVLQRSVRDKGSARYGSLVRGREYRYGDTVLSFYGPPPGDRREGA